ncbi:transcriptional regulator SyrB [Candidatus Photodesmus blepharus]|uniref:Transcriptional regulator SyrB n=1 Tax=Candidatus Photodesmus blepharonis TaxID=1179155 RepID=A0A084CN37_9GAMM|nr:DUF2786 domain-containing protein [Candidatus Photodesmus blepharus]KEY91216.1 transcriptional regulator SyrB [Candidatus Photodesmus blepharus]
MNKQKALKKITKCLELGNSGNLNEAANAIKMAHALMLKYGLDKDDIHFIKMGKTQSIHLLPADMSSTLLKIIRGLNKKFGVEAVLLNHKGLKRIEFIGEIEYAIFAAFAFDVLYKRMNEHAGQFKNSFIGSGLSNLEIIRRVNSFISGWIEGALEKLPVIISQNRPKEAESKINDFIEKEFQNINREMFKQRYYKTIKNLTVDYETGLKKGRKLSINRPIDGKSDRPCQSGFLPKVKTT